MAIHVIDLMNEDDELVGYGICVETPETSTERATFRMLPEVYGGRSGSHTAALDVQRAAAESDPRGVADR
jgi:hypothetical protein